MIGKMSLKTGMVMVVVAVLLAWGLPAAGQDNMQILRDKIKADKKLLVATNMELTDAEAKGFWPVYEEYQKELTAINQRIGKLIESYAADYRAKLLTDQKAKKLVEEMVAIEKAEAAMKAAYVPKLGKVLPQTKVARYLQIENKIRALVKYELAGAVPLAQ
jgi:hypothetical protein